MSRTFTSLASCSWIVCCLLTVACGFNGSAGGYPSKQVGGLYTLYVQNCYSDPNQNNLIVDSGPIFTSQILTYGIAWSALGNRDDTLGCNGEPALHASDFTGPAATGADFLFFSGHGDVGQVELYDYIYSSHEFNTEGGSVAFNAYDPGLPWATGNSGLKWVFFDSSQTVRAASGSYDWLRAFNRNQSGIHGVYGFEFEPSGFDDANLIKTFLDSAIQNSSHPNPVSVHDAWIAGALQDGDHSYGIYELQNARDDQLSGYSAQYTPVFTQSPIWSSTNPVVFYDVSQATPFYPTQMITQLSNTSPGTYTVMSLSTENWSDSLLASKADQYEPGSAKYYSGSNQYRIVSTSYSGSHFESSGAALVVTRRSSLPYTFTLNDAQAYAVSQLQQYYGGLPTDAVLEQIGTDYETDPSGKTILGYTFFWRHKNGVRGGDEIIVGVDNTSKTQCIDWEVTDGCPPRKHCVQWQTNYYQHANYVYRLWRSLHTAIVPQTYTPALSPAQAFTAAAPQVKLKGSGPNLGSFVGYTYGYWTPPYWATNNTAYPAYHFYYTSGAVVSADAASGQVYAIRW